MTSPFFIRTDMENNYYYGYNSADVEKATNVMIKNVYLWMCGALAITGLTAYYVASSQAILSWNVQQCMDYDSSDSGRTRTGDRSLSCNQQNQRTHSYVDVPGLLSSQWHDSLHDFPCL